MGNFDSIYSTTNRTCFMSLRVFFCVKSLFVLNSKYNSIRNNRQKNNNNYERNKTQTLFLLVINYFCDWSRFNFGITHDITFSVCSR